MSPSSRPNSSWVLRGCEWFFALFGAVVCVGVAIGFASQQSHDLWPTPGFYFVEIILLALLALSSRVVDVGAVKRDYSLFTWIAGGALLAFVILGGFSIGPYLLPAMLAFWLAATLGDIRQKRPIPAHLALTLVAAVFQAALIGILLLVSGVSMG